VIEVSPGIDPVTEN